MKLYRCDICHKLVQSCIEVDADIKYFQYCPTYRTGEIKGEYCQDCADRISAFIEGLKEEE